MKVSNQKGITLIALAVMIVVLTILTGITINYGKSTIEKAKLENVKTNMLLLQGKLKTYAEQAKFQGVDSIEKLEEFSKICTKVSSNSTVTSKAKKAGISDVSSWYYFTSAQLEYLGLKDIQNSEGEFIVKFDIENATVNDSDVVYTTGYNGSYTLQEISSK
jgi:Tfp pilus assembly protein PilE